MLHQEVVVYDYKLHAVCEMQGMINYYDMVSGKHLQLFIISKMCNENFMAA